jgi:hypothetical protein
MNQFLARHGAYYCLYARDYKAPALLLSDVVSKQAVRPQCIIYQVSLACPGTGSGNR